jgi:hypothetical protein
VRIRHDEADAVQPALDEAPEKRRPEGGVLGRAHAEAQDLAVPVGGDADRDHRRLSEHAAVHPHLVVRRFDPEVPMLAGQGARPKRRDRRVELAADARTSDFEIPSRPSARIRS